MGTDVQDLTVNLEKALTDRGFVSSWNAARYGKIALKASVERRYVMAIFSKPASGGRPNPLWSCTVASIQNAMLDAAAAGLSLSPVLGFAYLVPYGDVCTFTPGYRGMVHLGMLGGTIKSVQAALAYQHDHRFDVWTDENGRHIEHRELTKGNRGEVTHSYCIAQFMNGARHIEVLDRGTLDYLQSIGKSPVWKIERLRGEMQKKSAVRRSAKFWPLDPDGHMAHMLNLADKHDPVDFDRAPTADGGDLLISEDQRLGLHAAITDQGLEADIANNWLLAKAQRMGFRDIGQLPVHLYDEVKADLAHRAKVFAAQQESR